MAFLSLLLLSIVPAKSIHWTPDSAGFYDCELALDAYSTTINLSRSLTAEPIERFAADGERATDEWLFTHLLSPREVLVEPAVNPLPLGGWAVRRWAFDAYQDATYQGTNLVQALTEGYPEPWGLSLFLGNVVNLVTSADTSSSTGMGYSGMVLTWGAWNLSENHMIRDDWLQPELRIKGYEIRPGRKMGWSFRAGLREHAHREIRNEAFVSIIRSRTDFLYSGWNPLRNSSLELGAAIDQASFSDFPTFDFLRWSAILGKKFPFAQGKMAWALSVGVVQELLPAYTGNLRTKAPQGWKLVLQPDLDW